MAFSKRGSRKIVVNDTAFVWVLREYEIEGKDIIRIRLDAEPSGQLTVEHMWFGFQKMLEGNQSPGRWCLPEDGQCIVTPSFVAEAIKYALGLGWTPETKNNFTLVGQQQPTEFVFI